MPIIEAVILLMTLVLASNIISHYLTFIPVGLIQVVLGLFVALIFHFEIVLNTNWFLLLFIAPLLYNDGRRFPKQELWRLRGPIFGNAILLVFITTLVGGFLINWLVPQLTLPSALALAAILSPTDPVAVQSIAKRANLPQGVLHLVSGESLINDASGLIGFKYAIAAAITGAFSLFDATVDFFYISIVGIIAGLIFASAIQLLRDWLHRQGIDDIIFNTVLSITAPFIIYLGTEELLHASGVIAVVAAGVLSHTWESRLVEALPEERLVTERTWDILIYGLNGMVFVILGIELPFATAEIIRSSQFETWLAISYAFASWLIILMVRVIWVYTYQWVAFARKRTKTPATIRMAFVSGLSGVRGAITMAGVLSIPLTIAGGHDFPYRSLIIFIAAGVIIISLLAATIMLPIISPGNAAPLLTRASAADNDDNDDDYAVTGEPDQPHMTEDEAQVYTMRLAISTIEEHRRVDNQRAAYDLILDYQFLIRRTESNYRDDATMQRILDDEITLRKVGLDGERQAIQTLLNEKQITQASARIATRRIDVYEQRMTRVAGMTTMSVIRNWRLTFSRALRALRIWLSSGDTQQMLSEAELINREGAKSAIKSLSQYLARSDVDADDFDNQAIYHLVVHYRNRLERAKPEAKRSQEEYQRQVYLLRTQALGAERAGIQNLLEAGRISWRLAASLRQYVNYSENVLLMSVDEDE